jgi:two-component system, LytTR family, response regulator
MNVNIDPKKIAISSSKGLEFIDIDSIVRIEAERSYCTFYLNNTRKILVSKCLNDYENLLLSYGFVRIHNSHLVNIDYIKTFVRGDGGYIELADDTCVPVARNRKDNFLESIKSFCR